MLKEYCETYQKGRLLQRCKREAMAGRALCRSSGSSSMSGRPEMQSCEPQLLTLNALLCE